MTIHLKGSPPLTYLRLAVATAFLAAGLAADALLGPFVLDAIRYRVSHDMQNQVIGGDAAMLLVAVPVAVFAAILLWRGHRAGPVVALAPAVFALYTMPQLIAGDEYLELPGNNERFFALQLGIFVLAGIVLVGPGARRRTPDRRCLVGSPAWPGGCWSRSPRSCYSGCICLGCSTRGGTSRRARSTCRVRRRSGS